MEDVAAIPCGCRKMEWCKMKTVTVKVTATFLIFINRIVISTNSYFIINSVLKFSSNV